MYIGKNLDEIDSKFIRDVASHKGNHNSISNFTATIPEGTKRILIAIPKTGKQISKIVDIGVLNVPVTSNFLPIKEISVAGYNDYNPIPYNVWVFENENGLKATQYEFIF
jgi:hypothetical protein